MILNCTTSHSKIRYGAFHQMLYSGTTGGAPRQQAECFACPSALWLLSPPGLSWVCTLAFTLPRICATCMSLSFCRVFQLGDSGAKEAFIHTCFVEWPMWRGRGNLFFSSMICFDYHFWNLYVVYPSEMVSPPSHPLWAFAHFLTRILLEFLYVVLLLLTLFLSRPLSHKHAVWQRILSPIAATWFSHLTLGVASEPSTAA